MNVASLWKWMAIAAGLCATAEARLINFYSPPAAVNLTENGDSMDGQFVFQLGVFANGFVPTISNLDQWSAHWTAAQSAAYNGSFNGNFMVTGNAAPFTVGAKAYIWGRRSSSRSDEWILFRGSGWNWPAPDPMSPFDLVWSSALASESIVGRADAGGMRSETLMSYAQWQTVNPVGGAADDPDFDGVPNLLEFVFGTSPSQPSASPVSFAIGSHLEISIPRLRNRLAKVTAEVSGDLIAWKSGAGFTTVVSDTGGLLVVRDNAPTAPGLPRRFMRVKAEIAP